MKRSEKQNITKIIVRTVWMMFVFLKPALILAIRNPRKDANSIGMTGRKNASMIHIGYMKNAG